MLANRTTLADHKVGEKNGREESLLAHSIGLRMWYDFVSQDAEHEHDQNTAKVATGDTRETDFIECV